MKKTCCKCKVHKDLTEFYRLKKSPDGRKKACRECELSYSRKYQKTEQFKKYQETPGYKDGLKAYRNTNRDKIRAANTKYGKANRWIRVHHNNIVRAKKLNAYPEHWITEAHIKEMKALYKKAHDLTKETGIRYVVDHIHPLNSRTIQGLHVPWNLQVITYKENAQKSNKYERI